MATAFQSNAFQTVTLAFQIDSAPPAPGGGQPIVGNNDFWIKGHKRIGQKRRWRYWWETDPTDIPEEIAVAEDVEEIQAESNALASYITDLVIERAAERTLEILRTYSDLLQEQILARQQTARIAADLHIAEEKRIREAKILKRKRIILLLNE